MKRARKEEMFRGIWAASDAGYTETEIILRFQAVLSVLFGAKKQQEVVAEKWKFTLEELEQHIVRRWHNVVANYILRAGSMGEYVREQFVLCNTGRKRFADFYCGYSTVQQLARAKHEGKNSFTEKLTELKRSKLSSDLNDK